MTKYAIISDIHSNIDALNLAITDMERRNVDKIICLGDLVVKYFYPDKVVDAIKENSIVVTKGNCDYLVATDERYKFARSKLGLGRIEYLDNLPSKEQLVINKVLLNLYHSTPNNLEAMFNPIFDKNNETHYKDKIVSDYKKMFIGNDPQIAFVGHTHQDYIGVEKGDKLKIAKEDSIELSSKDRAIVNVGSVGEHSNLIKKNGVYVPNINDYLTYAIVDDQASEGKINVQIVRVPYKETLKKVYFNMIDLQEEKKVPFSPVDTGKVHDSLISMGYNEEEIKRGR